MASRETHILPDVYEDRASGGQPQRVQKPDAFSLGRGAPAKQDAPTGSFFEKNWLTIVLVSVVVLIIIVIVYLYVVKRKSNKESKSDEDDGDDNLEEIDRGEIERMRQMRAHAKGGPPQPPSVAARPAPARSNLRGPGRRPAADPAQTGPTPPQTGPTPPQTGPTPPQTGPAPPQGGPAPTRAPPQPPHSPHPAPHSPHPAPHSPHPAPHSPHPAPQDAPAELIAEFAATTSFAAGGQAGVPPSMEEFNDAGSGAENMDDDTLSLVDSLRDEYTE